MAVDNAIQLDRLARSFAAVGELVDAIQPDQWSAPTQCLDWTVHRLVEHLVGKNLVFTAVLAKQPLPQRGDGMPSGQLAPAYFDSAAVLLDAFSEPGVSPTHLPGPARYRQRSGAAEDPHVRPFGPRLGPRPGSRTSGGSAGGCRRRVTGLRSAEGEQCAPAVAVLGPARHVADAAPRHRQAGSVPRPRRADVPERASTARTTGGMPLVVREDGSLLGPAR